MRTLTTTIKRRWLAEIVAGKKKIEYREIKPYWIRRLVVGESAFAQAFIECPFRLRLINGMSKAAPEVTVLVDKVSFGYQPADPDLYGGEVFCLRIAKVISYKNWDSGKAAPPYRGVCTAVLGKNHCCREHGHRTLHASADGHKWRSPSTKNRRRQSSTRQANRPS